MKFTKWIATVAITSLAVNANAATEGPLRRTLPSEQSEQLPAAGTTTINVNTTAPTTVTNPATSTQPVTVVEATPAVESKAEALRKARQEAEVQTEQKIVERLEEERFKEEQARAERLFGPKTKQEMEKENAAAAAAATPAPPVAAPAPAAPVAQQPVAPAVETQPVIVQEKPVVPAAVEATSLAVAEEAEEANPATYYVSGLLGNLGYQARNVKGNYGVGVAVGSVLTPKWSVEAAVFFSNLTIQDATQPYAIYHKLDQTDFSVGAKYNVWTKNQFTVWGGASAIYINRHYTDKIYQLWFPNNYTNSQSTQSMNIGLNTGVDFAASQDILLGLGVDYNFNVMTFQGWDPRPPNFPQNIQELEKIDYWAIKFSAKYIF